MYAPTSTSSAMKAIVRCRCDSRADTREPSSDPSAANAAKPPTTVQSSTTPFPSLDARAVALFSATGITTVFTNLEGFPEDWKENPEAFVKFVREHQCPSFLEYGEYPYVTADEIKKALRLKAAFSTMLDQMQ